MRSLEDMESQVLQAFGENSKKRTFKCHFEFNFNNFQRRKLDKFQIDFYNIYTIGIDIINFDINIFNELVLTITLYLILLHNF